MHPHVALIDKFYAGFRGRDPGAMAECYHKEVSFDDPVFPGLKYAEVCAMWRMLNERGKDLQVTTSGIDADDREGRAHWEATYTFSGTGRKVHNRIDASFQFRDGLIVAHRDRFDFWAWTRMALGFKGLLLGWTPLVQGAVRAQARRALEKYMASGGGSK
ncbi:MAG: nuclear transport factor 2 family protein [Planctomycetes bacterium]|nr:nuclear transport factor 2 family protein [Planctomycetota bacterium]